MTNAATKPNLKVTAAFDKNEADKFLVPLADFQKVCGVKVTLRFNKDNTLSFKAINDTKNIIVYLNYLATGLPSLKVTEECKAPIFELDEFVSLARIFTNGFEFNFNESEKFMELVSGDDNLNQSFKFYISDESVVNKPPESLNLSKLVWGTKFTWDSKKYSTFVKGIATLKHPFVIFDGKKGEKSLTLSVSENKTKTATLKTVIKLDTENLEDIRLVVDKQNFLNPITSSVGNFEVGLNKRIMSLTGKSDYHEVTYYVSPVVEVSE